MNDIEQEIQDKGLTAPRVTPADIEANIASEHYFTAAEGAAGVVSDDMVNRFLAWPVPAGVYPDGVPGKPGRIGTNLLSAIEAREMLEHVVAAPAVPPSLGLLTFCVLVLRNGTKIVGINYGSVSPENFDREKGRRSARKHAIEQIWPLLGYELRSRLASMNSLASMNPLFHGRSPLERKAYDVPEKRMAAPKMLREQKETGNSEEKQSL